MPITFTNLTGDWRRIVEDYITDPTNAADTPGVQGTIAITPLLGEGRRAPKGVPTDSVFYTLEALDLQVYRGLLRDQNMNSDITVATDIDGYPVAWRASFDLQYRRQRIPLHDVIFGPDEIVDGSISLSSLVARDGVPPEYEGSYQQLMDAVRQAADSADAAAGSATDADASRSAAVSARGGAEDARDDAAGSATAAGQSAQDAAGAAQDALDHAQGAESWATSFDVSATADTGAPGTGAAVTVTGDGPAYALGFTVPRGDKGEQGGTGPQGPQGGTGPQGPQGGTGPQGPQGDPGPEGPKGDRGDVGPEGVQGPQGGQGVQGEVGPQGDEGPQGVTGDPGPKGDTGDVGPEGPEGPPGPKGDTGDPGPKGDKGEPGADGGSPTWDGITGKPPTFPPDTHTHTSSQISDTTTTGRAVMAASSQAAARTAIGAGTSSLALGTTASTAKAGNYQPTWADISGKPSTFPPSSHSHTPAEVGLSEVDNTADVDKPVSGPQQAALDGKIQLVSEFPTNPTPGVLYLTAED